MGDEAWQCSHHTGFNLDWVLRTRTAEGDRCAPEKRIKMEQGAAEELRQPGRETAPEWR